jgi:hypothetical protein
MTLRLLAEDQRTGSDDDSLTIGEFGTPANAADDEDMDADDALEDEQEEEEEEEAPGF